MLSEATAVAGYEFRQPAVQCESFFVKKKLFFFSILSSGLVMGGALGKAEMAHGTSLTATSGLSPS